jgi:hypothetical protein
MIVYIRLNCSVFIVVGDWSRPQLVAHHAGASLSLQLAFNYIHHCFYDPS